MKKLIVKILLGLLLFVIVGGIFYWYEFRPAHYRKVCMSKMANTKYSTPDEVRVLYEVCIHAKGIAE
jgi:hypothetical protein